MRKKVVLMIIPNLGAGGAQRSFTNISNALAETFVVVNVVFNTNVEPVYPLKNKLISLNIEGGSNVFSKLINFYCRVVKLKKIKKQNGATVSISFLEGADYINILSRVNDKIIVSVRGSKMYDGNIKGWLGNFRKKVLIPYLYKQADNIITVNAGIIKELNEEFGLRTIPKRVIYNFYNRDEISSLSRLPLPDVFNWLPKENYIVICSRLAREKNILPMISVFSRLVNKGYKSKLVIIGDGPQRMFIEAHCC
jgi:glycosyltransferase involved in cell wall biosynthesis